MSGRIPAIAGLAPIPYLLGLLQLTCRGYSTPRPSPLGTYHGEIGAATSMWDVRNTNAAVPTEAGRREKLYHTH